MRSASFTFYSSDRRINGNTKRYVVNCVCKPCSRRFQAAAASNVEASLHHA